jgi:pilus assembly protein CpaF
VSILDRRNRKPEEPAKKVKPLPGKPEVDADGDMDALFDAEISKTTGKLPLQEPESFVVGSGSTRTVVKQVLQDGSWLLDTGYVVPPKQRTPERLAKLRAQIRPKLLAFPDEADTWGRYEPDKIDIITKRFTTVIRKMVPDISREDYQQLLGYLLDDVLGFGPVQPLIEDPNCSEIMVNGPEVIFAEHRGKMTETGLVFDDEDHIYWVTQRIVRPMQRDFNRANPMVDARLPDGSRVHLITLPSALQGTTITIRKFPVERLTIDHLIKWGSLTVEVGEFLRACVVSRLNIVVSGGTGSGKTTLLNVLSNFIPEDERIITVEDSAELQLAQRHTVRLETCPPIPGDAEKGRLTIRDLVKGSLRMRPDRLVVGEVRSGEALDMLQAMNTGHDGSLTTVHANSPRDAVARLETLSMMAGMDLPVSVIRQQIASAIHLFIQQARLKDGSRKVVQIAELQGMEGDRVVLQDLFVYTTDGHTGRGYAHEGGGTLDPTGLRPSFMGQLKQYGFHLSPRVFGIGAASGGSALKRE